MKAADAVRAFAAQRDAPEVSIDFGSPEEGQTYINIANMEHELGLMMVRNFAPLAGGRALTYFSRVYGFTVGESVIQGLTRYHIKWHWRQEQFSQIAQDYGLTPSAVKNRVHQTISYFRLLLRGLNREDLRDFFDLLLRLSQDQRGSCEEFEDPACIPRHSARSVP